MHVNSIKASTMYVKLGEIWIRKFEVKSRIYMGPYGKSNVQTIHLRWKQFPQEIVSKQRTICMSDGKVYQSEMVQQVLPSNNHEGMIIVEEGYETYCSICLSVINEQVPEW